MSLPSAQPNYHFSHVTTAGEHKVGRQSEFNDVEDNQEENGEEIPQF